MSIAATYVDADTFTVVGDQTTLFHEGRRIKADCGGDGNKFGTILSSSFSDSTTEVVLTTTSDNLTANLTVVWFGIIGKGANQSVPDHTHETDEGAGGEIEKLYYDGTKVFETTAAGFDITLEACEITVGDSLSIKGDNEENLAIFIEDAETRLYHNGTLSIQTTSTGFESRDVLGNSLFLLLGSDAELRSTKHGASFLLSAENTATGAVKTLFKGDPDAGVKLYHDGVKVLETFDDGTKDGITFGLNSTASLKAEKTDGDVHLDNTRLFGEIFLNVTTAGGLYNGVQVTGVGRVNLYGDGVSRFETRGDGVIVRGGGKLSMQATDQLSATTLQQGNSVFYFTNSKHGGEIQFIAEDTGGSPKVLFNLDPDAAVDLYYAGVLKAQTLDDGFKISTGILTIPETTTQQQMKMKEKSIVRTITNFTFKMVREMNMK